jgi:hypothetical protein
VVQAGSGNGFFDVTQDPSSPYYVGELNSTQLSGDQIRAQATAQIDQEIANGWLGDSVTPQQRDADIQRLYEQRISQARQDLDEGLQMRNPGTPPQTMWENASHEQMQQAITQDANSATVAASSEEWVALGNELTEHQHNLAAAIEDSMSDWQGSGGDAVRQHLAAVGKWLGSTASGATLTGRQQEIHSQVLNETQKRMAANPPVQFSPQEANARLQQITDPVQYANQASQDMQTYREQQAAREEAARAMTQFDSTIGSAVATPEFPAPPKLAQTSATLPSGMTGTTGVAPGTGDAPSLNGPNAAGGGSGLAGNTAFGGGSGGGAGGGPGLDGIGGSGGSGIPLSASGNLPGGGSGSGGSGGSGGFGGSGHGGTNGIPPLDDGGFSSGGGSNFTGSNVPPLSTDGLSGDTTASSAFNPPSSIGYTGGVAGDGIASRLGGGPLPSTQFPAGNVPPLGDVPGLGGTSGLGGNPGAIGVGGLGGAGGAGGAGDDLSRSARGFGAGMKGGASSASGEGLARGASSGAGANEEAGATRSAGGSGPAGSRGATSGSPLGHGGRGGKREEDKEHHAADYLEGDPDLFKGEQVIAPPVIGDWKNNKKKRGDNR